MMEIDAKSFGVAADWADQVGKSGPFMTSHIINGILPKTRKYLSGQATRKLDKGATSFVAKTGLRYDKALYKKGNQGKVFWVKDAFFMEEVIRGGMKKPRNRRLPEPNLKPKDGKPFRLDRFGNIPKNFQQQVSVRAKTPAMSVSRATLRAKYLSASGKNIIPSGSDRRFKNLFLIEPGDPNVKTPGIYRKDRRGNLKLLIGYKRKRRQQRQIWDAGTDAKQYFDKLFPFQFRKSFAYVMKTKIRAKERAAKR